MTATPAKREAAPCPPPPRVRGLPLVGSAIDLFRDPIGFLLLQYRHLGPIFRLEAAHLDYVVMVGPEANEFAHGPGSHCLSAKEFWRPLLNEIGAPNSIVGLEGDDHATLRRLLAPGMSKKFAEDHIGELVRIARESLSSSGFGQAIPFVKFAQRLVSKQVGFLMTGEVPSREEHEAILRYMNAVSIDLSLRRLPRAALLLRGPGLRRDKRTAFAFADRLVAARRASGPSGWDHFLDTVLEASTVLPHLFTAGDIRNSGILPFFAGVDTVAQTLAFAVWEVLRRPALLDRVRSELDGVWREAGPSRDDLRDMPCLQAVVLETLRLHPTAFAMSRTASERFDFAGRSVEAGQDVLVFTTAGHFLEEYFPHPEDFDIDRFRPPRNEHRRPNVFAPFGRGPHACLGANFGVVQLAVTLGAVLCELDLALADPQREYKEVLMPTPSLGDAFEVIFHGARHSDSNRDPTHD